PSVSTSTHTPRDRGQGSRANWPMSRACNHQARRLRRRSHSKPGEETIRDAFMTDLRFREFNLMNSLRSISCQTYFHKKIRQKIPSCYKNTSYLTESSPARCVATCAFLPCSAALPAPC